MFFSDGKITSSERKIGRGVVDIFRREGLFGHVCVMGG